MIKCWQQELHRFVTVKSDDRGPEMLAGFGIEDDFHHPACLADLNRTADPRHRPGADQDPMTGGAGLGLAHVDPAKGRVDEQRMDRLAVTDLAVLAVRQVARDDLEVIIGGVGKGPTAIRVARHPDVRLRGAAGLVHRDCAARVSGQIPPLPQPTFALPFSTVAHGMADRALA